MVGVTTARPLLHLMQVPDSILPLAALYLRIYFLGMPAAMLYNFGAALLRSVGDTRRPLYYLIAAGVLNVALNLLLVIVFRLDVAGVAIATVVSQCLSAFLVVRCLMHEEGDIRLEDVCKRQSKRAVCSPAPAMTGRPSCRTSAASTVCWCPRDCACCPSGTVTIRRCCTCTCLLYTSRCV